MSDPQTDLETLAVRTVMASFDGGTLPEWARRRLVGGMAGICLFGENVTSIEAVGRLCAAIHEAAPDAIVSLDEEGGDVTRLYYRVGSPHAGHAALGAVDYPTLTRAVAQDIGSELLAVGVDLDLAPVADVNSNPLNPVIGVRSFGAEPELVARHVAAFVDGLQSAGVGACLKHFPGHGDTVADSHVALPVVEAPVEVLRERELVPFRAGIAAEAVAVMTSHVVVRALDPDRPATFSALATRLLRAPEADGGLGFDGLLVSDALDMQGASGEIGVPAAAVQALAAGVDLLCLGPHVVDDQVQAVLDAIVAAVRSGELSQDRLVEAAGRVDTASARLRELRATAPTASLGDGASSAAAREAITVDGPLGPLPGAQVLRFVAGANIAAGHVPWGLPHDGRVLAGSAPVEVVEGRHLPDLDADRPVVALVRGGHRYAWVVAGLTALARRRPDLVVVELGWPGPDRLPGRTVVHTFGASAVSGRALDDRLSGALEG
ncbi:MAG TPA: glycoside hydrolase family 3 N-terminal domain-containing protein [Lapillicoccus sp.]|uniref:glycoside hydrolase family 3 protein n=1 Tax=Lapillicoccus sp. TaxID=1909287 RepID=UPI002F95589A